MSSFLRKALSNSVWTSLSSVANAVLSLLVAGLVIRWLGLDEAGFVLFFQAIVGANKSLFSLGMTGGCLRYVSESHGRGDQAESQRLMNTILSFNVLSTGLLVAALALMIPWFIEISDFEGDERGALYYGLLALTGLLLTTFSQTLSGGLEAAQEFRFLALAQTVFRSLANGAKVLFLTLSPTLLTLGLVEVTVAALSAGIYIFKFVKVYRFVPRMRPKWSVFVMLWRFSRWAYLQSLSFMVLGNLDRVVIGGFFSASALPFYSMAKRGYLIGHEVISGLASFFFPMLSSVGEQKHEIIERIEPRVRWILTGIGVFFYGGMVLVGPQLLNWIVRPGFGDEIAHLVLIFGCVGVVSLQTVMPYHISMATDRPWLATLTQYVYTGTTFLLMLFFAWQDSITGIVVAHFADVFAVVLFYVIVSRENRNFWRLCDAVLSPILSTLAGWAVVLAIWVGLFVNDAPWYAWFAAAAVGLPLACLLIVLLERVRGDRYRNLETVRSIQSLAAERFAPLGAVPIPFVGRAQVTPATDTP